MREPILIDNFMLTKKSTGFYYERTPACSRNRAAQLNAGKHSNLHEEPTARGTIPEDKDEYYSGKR